MKKINDFLKKKCIKPLRYEKNGKVYIIDCNDGRFILKKRKNNNEDLYKYLQSRSFDYYPNILDQDEEYIITEYLEDISIPNEQKIIDLVDLVGLLHSKTTHYKETTQDDYKKLYEDINGNIEYLYYYYDNLMNTIENHIYMSPHEYLLARNISKIYEMLEFCKEKVEEWFNYVKDKTKQRYVVLHNNLELSHFIKNDRSYLINWEKAKIDLPIFDIYKLYKKHYLDFEFSEVLKNYENNYPLNEEEKLLFFILISLPEKLNLEKNEYNNCVIISNEIDRLYKSSNLVSFYYVNNDDNSTYNN